MGHGRGCPSVEMSPIVRRFEPRPGAAAARARPIRDVSVAAVKP
ncbi:hypothetical protein BUH_3542 [Burkholderia pseudomallei Pakistan 9]|nr:hypothetical protein BUH_3542 [Burkholderia pseudomallei Pakistan 9]